MRKNARLILLATAVLLGVGSCIALFPYAIAFVYNGGGRTQHSPPVRLEFDKPTHMEIRASVWGPPQFKSMSQRWTDFICVYRLIGEDKWKQLPMTVQREASDEIVMVVSLPAFPRSEHIGIEYYIAFVFDGRQSGYGAPEGGPIRVPFAGNQLPSGAQQVRPK